MEFVDGHVLRDDADRGRRELTPAARAGSRGEHLIDVLAALHAVDVDAVGLGDLGRQEGYIERQLRRWYGQFQQSAAAPGPAVPGGRMRSTTSSPAASRRRAWPPIVHGDYRLDNTVLGADARVAAVLDWELCTLGDPLADLGLLMVYWTDRATTSCHSASRADRWPRGSRPGPRSQARYAAGSGRDLSHARLLRRLRLLEAGLHPPGRLRPLRRRGRGRGPERGRGFAGQIERAWPAAAEH